MILKSILVDTCVCLAVVSFLVGCSSGGSSSEPASTSTEFDGSYDTTVTPITQFDINGGACANASGVIKIINSEISGSVISGWGDTYIVSGNVQSNGDVSGGFAFSGQLVASFEGAISGNTGSGTWKDINECSGTWQSTKTTVVVNNVFGSLTITGSSQVPSTFSPDTSAGASSLAASEGWLQNLWMTSGLPIWSLAASIADDYAGISGASIKFEEAGGIGYTCESGFVGLYGDCSGATFDHNTRTVTFSNVQLQAPGFGTVITLNGTLVY